MKPKQRKKKGILLESGTNEVEFLRFFLKENFFGINVAKIRKVIVFEKEQFSAIPSSIRGLPGNYLYRGECIPLIDLKEYLNIGEAQTEQLRLILICEFNQCTVGFIIDKIRDIMRCSWGHFAPSKGGNSIIGHECVTGNVIWDEEITPILDVEAVLANIIPSSGIGRDMSQFQPKSVAANAEHKILYCEDSPTVQRVLIKCLSDLGFSNVVTLNNGQEGLEYLKLHRGEVDLIISDIEMPRMDGLTFCKEVRLDAEHKKLPFLFFSSTVTEEMKEKCKHVGGTASFSKPEIANLTSFLEGALQQ